MERPASFQLVNADRKNGPRWREESTALGTVVITSVGNHNYCYDGYIRRAQGLAMVVALWGGRHRSRPGGWRDYGLVGRRVGRHRHPRDRLPRCSWNHCGAMATEVVLRQVQQCR